MKNTSSDVFGGWSGESIKSVVTLCLAVVLVLALILRMAGLFRDFPASGGYHPDSPKQVRAALLFLDGQYNVRVGRPVYDGYPLFHARLLEGIWRCERQLVPTVSSWLRLPAWDGDEASALFATLLLLNVLLSTGAVLLLYGLAREIMGRRPALLAALLLALCPVDVTAAHFATGDTVAGFFALVSLWGSLRVALRGRYGDYVLAVAGGIFGFASKYHAVLLMVPLALAHLRFFGWGMWTRTAWKRVVVSLLVALVCLSIAIPKLVLDPVQTVADIRGFLALNAQFSIPEAVAQGPLWARIAYAWTRTFPDIGRALGTSFVLAVLMGVLLAWLRNHRVLGLAILLIPLYAVVVLGLRPAHHVVYLTIVTPTLCLLAAHGLTKRIPGPRWLGGTARVAQGLLLVISLIHAAGVVAYETRMVLLPDTRRLAGRWVEENVPQAVAVLRSHYTFYSGERHMNHPEKTPATVLLYSSLSPGTQPGAFPLGRLAIERNAMPVFRNPDIELSGLPGPWWQADWKMPVFQRIPRRPSLGVVLADCPGFYISDRLWSLENGEQVQETVFSEAPFARVLVGVWSGVLPFRLVVNFGGQQHTIELAPCSATTLPIETPVVSRGLAHGPYGYRLSLRSVFGRGRVELAVTPAERGVLRFQAGQMAESTADLVESARQGRHPTLALMALIGATAQREAMPDSVRNELKALVAPLASMATLNRVRNVYGISPDYLDGLPYLTLFDAADKQDEAEEGKQDWTTQEHPMWLEPGVYRVVVRSRNVLSPDMLSFQVRAGLHEWWSILPQALSANADPRETVFRLELPCVPGELWFRFNLRNAAGQVIENVRVQPDVLGTLDALASVYRALEEVDASSIACGRLGWIPLLKSAAVQPPARAIRLLARADAIRCGRIEALDGLATLASPLPPDVRETLAPRLTAYAEANEERRLHGYPAEFEGGIRLRGFRVQRWRVARGQTAGLQLVWDSSLDRPERLQDLVASLHFVDATGRVVFQADRPWQPDLMFPEPPRTFPVAIRPIPVPGNAPPGRYRVRLGLWSPNRHLVLRLESAPQRASATACWLPLDLEVTE